MRLLLIQAFVFALMVVAGPPVAADEQIGAFAIFDDMPDIILMDGEIGINTPLEFRRALAARPKAKVIVLGSPGGYVASALILAGDVHTSGLSTAIPKGFGCYSACAFVFFAGKERLAEGELGVHQMAGANDPSGVQSTVSDIIEALEEFDTPTEVITRMFRTPSESMYVFTPSELNSLDVNRLGPVVLTTANIGNLEPPRALPNKKPADTAKTSIVHTSPSAAPNPPAQSFGPRVALYGGLDFYGNDISSQRAADVVQCVSACMANSQCQAFTFNANPKLTRGPNCFLKSDVTRLEAYEDALSGVFLPAGNEDAATYSIGAIDPTRDVLSGKGLTGPDFLTSPERGISSPGACRMACVDDNACQAFTYDSRLQQCYLKGAAGVEFSMDRLTSGIKRGASYRPLDVIDLNE
ncbi:MAG: hypothetical protein ABS76_14295 [Pelagibacterium sp. SCN 64-44]|nr:MAG: hypothetical protein ABS76_14295 [Pelagibacterium sp. SCN 64-44]